MRFSLAWPGSSVDVCFRYKKIEAAYEQNVVMPELEHRREVLKKLRQQFEPIDLKQIAKEWDENHPVDAVRKKFKTGGNGHANQDASAFAALPSIYRSFFSWLPFHNGDSHIVTGDPRLCALLKKNMLQSSRSKRSIKRLSTNSESSANTRKMFD